MRRAIGYVRVSTVDQAQNNLSLQGQQEAIKRYCDDRNIHLLKMFVEPGASAMMMDRPQWTASLEYCQQNADEIDYYIVWRVDRFSRKVQHHAEMAASIRKLGIQLQSVMENFDDTPTGIYIETMFAANVELDNNNRILNTKLGMARRQEEGGYVAPAPLGYKNVRDDLKRPTLEKTEVAPIIASLFRDFIKGGYNLKSLAEEADRRGLRTKAGNKISYQSLRQMLVNPVCWLYTPQRL